MEDRLTRGEAEGGGTGAPERLRRRQEFIYPFIHHRPSWDFPSQDRKIREENETKRDSFILTPLGSLPRSVSAPLNSRCSPSLLRAAALNGLRGRRKAGGPQRRLVLRERGAWESAE
ncbi:hypothetical protein AOLI_G00082020 [Acnodon oligacanthus]